MSKEKPKMAILNRKSLEKEKFEKEQLLKGQL